MSLHALERRLLALRRESQAMADALADKVAEMRRVEAEIKQAKEDEDREADRRTILGFLRRARPKREPYLLTAGDPEPEPDPKD